MHRMSSTTSPESLELEGAAGGGGGGGRCVMHEMSSLHVVAVVAVPSHVTCLSGRAGVAQKGSPFQFEIHE